MLIPGDGIGPEVTAAARRVMDATGVALDWHTVHLGAPAIGQAGDPVPPATVAAIRAVGTALKGPVATPQDGSMPSPNVGLRRALGLTFQLRRVEAFGLPPDRHFDVVIVRETTEDLYAGIGFDATSSAADAIRQASERAGTPLPRDAGLSIKYLSESSCRAVWDFAVAEARRAGCSALTAAHKTAVMPHTDGIFLRVGREIVERAGLQFDAVAVDTLAARMATAPWSIQLIVAPNLYGDILADLAGALAGGVGVVAGGNYGSSTTAVFEAAHGAAWRHAGRDTANPVGMVLSGALALDHLGHQRAAVAIRRAVRAVGSAVVDDDPRRLRTTALTERIIAALEP